MFNIWGIRSPENQQIMQWMEDLTSKQLNGLNMLQVKGHVCFPMIMLLNLAGFPICVFGCFHTRSKYRYNIYNQWGSKSNTSSYDSMARLRCRSQQGNVQTIFQGTEREKKTLKIANLQLQGFSFQKRRWNFNLSHGCGETQLPPEGKEQFDDVTNQDLNFCNLFRFRWFRIHCKFCTITYSISV